MLIDRTLVLSGCFGVVALFASCVPGMQGVSPPFLMCGISAAEQKPGTVVAGQPLVLEVGPHRLVVPAGAADAGTAFRFIVVPGAQRMVNVVQVPSVPLRAPADLSLSFSGCPTGTAESYRVWRRPDDSGQWMRHPDKHEVIGSRVRISLREFSTYALASN